jgi:hypothetical protein
MRNSLKLQGWKRCVFPCPPWLQRGSACDRPDQVRRQRRKNEKITDPTIRRTWSNSHRSFSEAEIDFVKSEQDETTYLVSWVEEGFFRANRNQD